MVIVPGLSSPIYGIPEERGLGTIHFRFVGWSKWGPSPWRVSLRWRVSWPGKYIQYWYGNIYTNKYIYIYMVCNMYVSFHTNNSLSSGSFVMSKWMQRLYLFVKGRPKNSRTRTSIQTQLQVRGHIDHSIMIDYVYMYTHIYIYSSIFRRMNLHLSAILLFWCSPRVQKFDTHTAIWLYVQSLGEKINQQ